MNSGMLKELCGGRERDAKLNMHKEIIRTVGKEFVVKKYERISSKERREDWKMQRYSK
jgi:hypothetical protein